MRKAPDDISIAPGNGFGRTGMIGLDIRAA